MPPLVIATTIGALVVAAMIWALVDLNRHDVAYLPKGAWAALIVLLSIIGVGVYLLAGRIPADGRGPLVARLQREQGGDAAFMLWGMGIGLLVGTVLGQIALGLAIGLFVGALVDAYRSHTSDR